MRTLAVGEALIDEVTSPGGAVAEHVGGSPANVAFGLAALGHDVELATWLGVDAHGARIEQVCRSRGVALTPGSHGAASTPVAHALLDERGSATYTFDLEWAPETFPAPGSHGHVHTGSIGAVLQPGALAVRQFLALAHQAGATVSYDPNLRPALMTLEEARAAVAAALALADVVKASDEDLAWLSPGSSVEQVAKEWAALGPAIVVVTLGAAGAFVRCSVSGEMTRLPAAAVHLVDTVGAGDSFMAGLISGLIDADLLGSREARERLRGATLDEVVPAVERALKTAALTVARAGAYAPGRNDLDG
ncbi:PfkB family carbohydrate kinase [Intrasporangium sp.]|uniref:PfkB family carbohydrate kinase n=1 Tax=Intrasporangium sp. TaxID=1925024 RepID=UPI0034641C18